MGLFPLTPERLARLRSVLDQRQPDLTVVTDFVHKQRNLSAIVRNCDAAGIMRVYAAIGGEDYRAFRGTTMGSHLWVKVIPCQSLEQALEPLMRDGYQTVAAHLGDGAIDYREIDYTRPTAIIMGAEKAGVSVAARARVDRCVSIPMCGMVGSYNVSVAAGIILAEAQQQRRRAGLYEQRRIDDDCYRTLFFQWAHPKLRDFCEERGLRYPELNDEGELLDAPGWYASVRAGTAARYPDPGESPVE